VASAGPKVRLPSESVAANRRRGRGFGAQLICIMGPLAPVTR